jgi:hypothetical protein
VDSADLHLCAHRLEEGDAIGACAALLRFVAAELAVEVEELKRERPPHQSEPERGVS